MQLLSSKIEDKFSSKKLIDYAKKNNNLIETERNELSNKIYEITNIWNCGIKKRHYAHQNYIYGWNDINCNAKNLNF